MWSLLCNIWLILLCLGLAFSAYWIYRALHFWSARSDAYDEVGDAHRAQLFILYMTPLCAAALGKCARPERLRHLTPACIDRLLQRFPFPDSEQRPSMEIRKSWPVQAQYICAGDYESLQTLQSGLRASRGDPDNGRFEQASGREPRSIASRRRVPFSSWKLCVIGLIVSIASLLAWMICSHDKGCGCATNPSTVVTIDPVVSVGWKTATLSTDVAFDYKMYEPRSMAHRERLKADLVALFRDFDEVTIRSVVARTDPIGGTEDNRILALRRKATIDQLIAEMVAENGRPKQFAARALQEGPALEGKDANGPSIDDKKFWQFCFARYVQDAPKSQRPLVDLPREKNTDDRVPCGRASPTETYPACARPNIPEQNQSSPPGYAQRAEGLRELTACLSPMRYVRIEFSYRRIVPVESKNNGIPNEVAAK